MHFAEITLIDDPDHGEVSGTASGDYGRRRSCMASLAAAILSSIHQHCQPMIRRAAATVRLLKGAGVGTLKVANGASLRHAQTFRTRTLLVRGFVAMMLAKREVGYARPWLLNTIESLSTIMLCHSSKFIAAQPA